MGLFPPLDVLARVPLLPVLIWQGLSIRRHALILPEASGPRHGVVGEGRDLRLLILGDSSAAGVGVSTQTEALCGQLVAQLAKEYRLEWELIARTGARTEDADAMLAGARRRKYDVVLTALGVNDAVRFVSTRKWREKQRQLRQRLREEFGAAALIVTAVPPMEKFEALTPLLQWMLGHQARRMDLALQQDLATETDSQYLTLDMEFTPDAMAQDGYHPSAKTYAKWGARAAELLRSAHVGQEN